MCTTLNSSRGRPFGPDGCQVPVGQGICGETRTLELINEFKRLYEEKMHQIDNAGGGDCLQEKVKLQQEWISDLSDQNEMLVRAVEELEHEATERVRLLEDKLKTSAQCLCEVMKRYREIDVTSDLLAEPLQKMFTLENDQKNLLEFIRRIREEKKWTVDGLKFFDIKYQDLFGSSTNSEDDYCSTNYNNECLPKGSPKEQEKLKVRESCIKDLETKVNHFKSFGDVESICNELKCKQAECENLKTSMADSQQALVEEIAGKHDQIMQLKRDCQQLEDRCVQADKQTAFRDDIIRELRKEVKQLKQQGVQEQREEIQSLLQTVLVLSCMNSEAQKANLLIRAKSLERKNGCLECVLKEDKEQINQLERKFQQFLKDKEELKQKHKEGENNFKSLGVENEKQKTEIEYLKKMTTLLENDLKAAQEASNNFKCKAENCSCRIEELIRENEKLMNEMVQLNEENRNLLRTLEHQKKRIDNTTKLTQDEVVKLKATIDDLQLNLQKTKQVRDEEEARYQENITKQQNKIKLLKAALKETAQKFEKDAKVCKICKGRSRVGFLENAEVQAYCDDDQLEKQMEALENKDEIIKVQSNTLELIQQELVTLKNAEMEVRTDRDRMCQEAQALRDKIVELENELRDSEGKATNLQMAVDLYLNSINVLEASEEKHKLETEHQKCTITNLQKALVTAKQELDEVRHKSEENQGQHRALINCFNEVLLDTETAKQALATQCEYVWSEFGHLQDLNYDLEVEHFSSLQDVDLLENQLFKYQTLLKSAEGMIKQYKCHMKKLLKQKRGYEEVIGYFKEEMTVMADQLCNLQQLLTLSNESTQEETNKLMQAFLNVQTLNDKLSTQLTAAEQKVLLENQMNQLHEAKINELQHLISERDLDLSRHDDAILNIRQTLQRSLQQNEELQSTIVALNDTITPLQEAIKKYECENSKSKESTQMCQTQIGACRDKLEELKASLDKKTGELFKLEMAYNNQSRALKTAQVELKQMRDRQKNKQCHMKCTIEVLRDKLVKAEENFTKLQEDTSKLQGQLAGVARKEAVKDMEVKRYRNIVGDLRKTLIDLNKSLTNREMLAPQGQCQNAECRKNMKLTGDPKDTTDICLNCPCEVEFYQSIVDTLKKSVIDLKKKLTETQQKNKQLEEESKRKEAQMVKISRTHSEKDKEYQDLKKKLMDKLKQTQAEEARYLEMAAQFDRELNSLRQELEVKTNQLDEVKKSAQEINSSRCIQLACAQEEVNNLKDELNGLLRQHRTLNSENEKLHNQSARMQSTVTTLEERSQLLKGQLEQYLGELQNVQSEKETLMRKNRELLTELRSIQGSYTAADKQQRYSYEAVKLLESELGVMRNSRDEISSDVKNVVGYVRAWLQEQRKINEYTARRERDYCDTIRRLRRDYEEMQCPHLPPCQRPCTRVITPCLKSNSPPPMCQSPWSLGSQGTASVRDPHSPTRSRSPYFEEENNDWYSPTFRNDSEEDEEDWVSKVENLAAQVRRTNKMWKNKMGQSEFGVSRDTKK